MTAPHTIVATPPEPPRDCPLCPRLVAFRVANQVAQPDWFNGAVPSVGPETARLLIVGLAPGLKGANRTGRPFVGDFAGDLLYRSLLKANLAKGRYDPSTPEDLQLVDCLITNAVRCVPPANKPTTEEIARCRPFLEARIQAVANLKTILALGRIAHDSTLVAFGLKRSAHRFAHGGQHDLPGGLVLYDSYHCSRQNTNTGRLTTSMFEDLLAEVAASLHRA